MPNPLSEYTAKEAQKAVKGDLHQFMQEHPEVLVEEKFDGTRVLVWRGGGFENDRTCLVTKHNGVYGPGQYPEIFRELSLERDTMLDAELVKKTNQLHVFDALFIAGQDNRSKPLWSRKITLEGILPLEHIHVHVVPAKFCNTEEAVVAYYDQVVNRGGEGVVVKDVRAAYGAKGSWLKKKAREDIDVFVIRLKETEGGRTEYEMGLYDENHEVRYVGDIYNADGSVDRSRIWAGSVLRVEYLPTEGYQHLRDAIIKDVRDDKTAEECTIEQL